MISKQQVIAQLEELLLGEYLQRDIYETYSHYLFGLESPAIKDHLKQHTQEEQMHIDLLQRHLMGLGAKPLIKRVSLPDLELGLHQILTFDLKKEKEAVANYSKAIHMLEDSVEFTSLRIDLEDILKQEQEHTHDLIQWLNCFDIGAA